MCWRPRTCWPGCPVVACAASRAWLLWRRLQLQRSPSRVWSLSESTPVVAAVAVQHTKDPVAEWWYGFFVSTSSGRPRLAERAQLVGGYDISEPDPHVLSFATASHKTVIAVPMNATDGIRIAFSTKKDAA